MAARLGEAGARALLLENHPEHGGFPDGLLPSGDAAFGLGADNLNFFAAPADADPVAKRRRGRPAGKRNEPCTSDRKPFSCQECSNRYKTQPGLKYHMEHTHSPDRLGKRGFTCDICSKSFESSARLSCHQKVHAGESPGHEVKSIHCEMPGCHKVFTTAAGYRYHRRHAHSGDHGKTLRCPHAGCDKAFASEAGLSGHLLGAHENVLPPTTTPPPAPLGISAAHPVAPGAIVPPSTPLSPLMLSSFLGPPAITRLAPSLVGSAMPALVPIVPPTLGSLAHPTLAPNAAAAAAGPLEPVFSPTTSAALFSDLDAALLAGGDDDAVFGPLPEHFARWG